MTESCFMELLALLTNMQLICLTTQKLSATLNAIVSFFNFAVTVITKKAESDQRLVID